jgi:hypothetical protein
VPSRTRSGVFDASRLGPAGWVFLAAAATVARLALTVAGPTVSYQHLLPVGRWFDPANTPASLTLLVQALSVAWALRRRVAGIIRTLGPGAIALVAVGLGLTAAALSRNPVHYVEESVVASGLAVLMAANAALAAWSIRPEPAPFGAGAGKGDDRFRWGLAAGVTLTCAVLALWPYERHPHVPDEVVYLFHARYLAHGLLAVPAPPVRAGFDVDLFYYTADRMFSPTPPGWPLLLAAGAWLGVPWLVNPVLAGCNILLTGRLLDRWYPRETSRLALLLLATSPWHLFLGMSFMTHTSTLTFGLLGATALQRGLEGGRAWPVALAGAMTGVVSWIRPLDGLEAAMILGLWLLAASNGVRRLRLAAMFGLGTVVAGLAVLPYNAYLTGSPTKFPIMLYTDAAYGPGTNAMGFGPNRGLGWPGLDPLPGHGLPDVFINAALNLFQINTELLGWATGSLLPILLWALYCRRTRTDYGMVLAIVVVAGLHSFYWFSGGPDFGARYWFLLIVPACALAARGLTGLAERLASAGVRDARPRMTAAALLLVGLNLVGFIPWRAADKYYHYRGMRADIRRLAVARQFGQSLVLIKGKRHPDYASAAAYNPVTLSGSGPIYAWDRNTDVRRAVVSAFPDRPVWIVAGPSLTNDGYQVIAGPLPPGTPLPDDP